MASSGELPGFSHRSATGCVVAQVGASPEVDHRLRVLRERVTGEVRLQAELLQIQGALEPILAAALRGAPATAGGAGAGAPGAVAALGAVVQELAPLEAAARTEE